MSLSLRDQLLKAGLVNQKQAKQVSKDKQKQQRLAHKGQAELDDSQQRAAQEAMAEKVKRDQELNRQQQEKRALLYMYSIHPCSPIKLKFKLK